MLEILLAASNQYLKIYVLHWNDAHGHMGYNEAFWLDPDFPPLLSNARALAYMVKKYREKAKKEGSLLLVFDAADYFQGDPLGELTKGKLYIDIMNYIGLTAGAVGNHDFDFGRDILDSLAKWANFPLLCANLTDTLGNPPSLAKPYIIIDTMGIRIAVFGLITHWLKGMVPPQNMPDLDVKWEYSFVKEFVPKLRKEYNPDIVIALTHTGFRHDQRNADSIRGIDLIIGGHSHTGLYKPYFSRINSTAIVQAFSHMANLGVVEILYDRKNKTIVDIKGKIITLNAERVPSDPYVDSVLTVYEKKVDSIYGEVVAISDGDFNRGGFVESSMGNIITDAMRWYVEERLGEKDFPVVAIYNAGGIRANFRYGKITKRDVYNALPFPNVLMYGKVKGEDLLKILGVGFNGHHAIFNVSGLKLEYNNDKLYLDSITAVIRDSITLDSMGVKTYNLPLAEVKILEVGGRPFHPDSTYILVSNDYLINGGGEYVVFKTLWDIKDTGRRISDIVEEYLRFKGRIKPQIEGRIRKIKGI
ncbi:MAG: bifunctional UDP-sugar hydrolase/5'-nucleotidase [candidate division WOR-3 bacterium]